MAAGFQNAFEHGLSQGRSLGWVGARAEFVENNKGGVVYLRPGSGQVFNLRGIGAQAIIKALLIADKGEYALPQGQGAAGSHRCGQAGEPHQGNQPQGLQADGFTAGVAAA